MAKYEGIPGVDASIKADRESRKRYTEREAASRKEDRESDYEALKAKYSDKPFYKLPFHVIKQISRASDEKKGGTAKSREAASRKEDRESDYEALRVKYGNRSIFKLPFHVLKQIERARRTNGNAGSQKKGSTGSSKPVKKMNRGGVVRRSKPRGVGVAKRGYGRAMR